MIANFEAIPGEGMRVTVKNDQRRGYHASALDMEERDSGEELERQPTCSPAYWDMAKTGRYPR